MRSRSMAIVAVAALIGLSACSGSGDDSSATVQATQPSASATATSSTPSPMSSTTPASTADAEAGDVELKQAVQAYSDAYLTGDADAAYALLSARCQKRMTKPEFTALVGRAKAQFGDALPFKSYDAELNGNQARVTYTYTVASINQEQEPWVLEDGAWREDDC